MQWPDRTVRKVMLKENYCLWNIFLKNTEKTDKNLWSKERVTRTTDATEHVITIQSKRKELLRVTTSKTLRLAITLAFDFDIICIKGNTIPHIDALCSLKFGNEKMKNHENAENKIQHWVEMEVLSLNRLRIETRY